MITELSRKRLLWAVAVAVGLAVLVAVAGVIQLRRAVDELDSARASIAAAERYARVGDLDGVVSSVIEAERSLSSARATLRSSAPVRVGRFVPGLRQNIDAAQTITDRAFDLAASARRVADAARPLTDGGLFSADGAIDPAALGAIRETSASVRSGLESLAHMELPARWLLLSQVEDAAGDLADGESTYHDLVASIDDGLTLVESLTGADGPSRWLIVAANAAEMRGAGGMPLSYAVLTADGGDVEVSEVGHDEDLNARLLGGVDVDLPADFRARYDGYNLTADVRNATISADFGVGGPVLAAMYEHATSTEVDGVLQVDSVALAGLLSVTGPVSVDGVGELNSENVVDITLHDLYTRFSANEQRQDALGRVSGEIVEHLLSSEPEPLDLLDALRRAVSGRHLMIYSSDPEVAAAVETLRAGGGLGSRTDLVHLAVENFSGNKLDYFVDVALELQGRWDGDGVVTATVTVDNGAEPGAAEPAYVYGPASPSLVAGQYRGQVVLYLPVGTEIVHPPDDGGVSHVVLGTENGRPVVTFSVDVFAGESRDFVLELELDEVACPSLHLVPSPRIRPVEVDVDVATNDGRLSFGGSLDVASDLAASC